MSSTTEIQLVRQEGLQTLGEETQDLTNPRRLDFTDTLGPTLNEYREVPLRPRETSVGGRIILILDRLMSIPFR